MKHVAVIGAGTIGLTTAWYLRERGAEVSVFEMEKPANGASWGNAGQILPIKSVPLSEPGNLKYALKSFFKKSSPITAPNTLDANLIRFLAHFMRNSTKKRHLNSANEMFQLGKSTFNEFAYLESHGVDTTRTIAPFTSAFSSRVSAHSVIAEFQRISKNSMTMDFEMLNGVELRKREPLVEEHYDFGLQLNNQSFVNPPKLVSNLVASLQLLDVEIKSKSKVKNVVRVSGKTQVLLENGKSETFDAVVIATGAWLNRLTAEHGVRMPVVAGIGYSMAVDVPHQTQGMLYFPETHLATTNYGNRLRISTFMQMGDVEIPRDPKRQNRLQRIAQNVIPQADWSSVSEFWSGARPLSGDGKPLLGGTRTEGIYVNSGHGMWGITLAPVSAKLLADLITGKHEIPKAFNPLR